MNFPSQGQGPRSISGFGAHLKIQFRGGSSTKLPPCFQFGLHRQHLRLHSLLRFPVCGAWDAGFLETQSQLPAAARGPSPGLGGVVCDGAPYLVR